MQAQNPNQNLANTNRATKSQAKTQNLDSASAKILRNPRITTQKSPKIENLKAQKSKI
ncbi:MULTISPECIES: hypothetical protein [unclassified Helicobacter]|uniref:hypothetical protein n=1 Tax=unclassified Helicobacter TaxID=2593540 RepID=UPI0012E91C45|nr:MULTISPECIES: hypothetical protein [unclassified Helicobacter]